MNGWEIAGLAFIVVISIAGFSAASVYFGVARGLRALKRPKTMKSEAWVGAQMGFIVSAGTLSVVGFGLQYTKNFVELSLRNLLFVRVREESVLYGDLAFGVVILCTAAGALWAAYRYDQEQGGSAA